MKKADLINIIKEDIQKLKNPELTKEKIDSAEELFNISKILKKNKIII